MAIWDPEDEGQWSHRSRGGAHSCVYEGVELVSIVATRHSSKACPGFLLDVQTFYPQNHCLFVILLFFW